MSGKFLKIKKMIIPMMTMVIIASQLMGCASASSKEFLALLDKGEAIEIEVALPESIEEGTEKAFEWVQLDQLSTYPEFRRAMDDALFITNFGDNSKNGILYVDLEGNHAGNNTLYNAFANNAFRENYWENEEVQKQVQEAVLEVYADVEAETEGIKVAALNAYYNLLPDAEPNYFNGESLINRGEFMAMLYRSENPVKELESNEEFTALVGESDNTDFAYSLAEDSYLSTSDKSLNTKTFNGTMTRGEAIYMLMNHFYGDELSSYTNSPSLPDIKNGGDIAQKQKFEGDYGTSVELMYALQNADSGAPEEIYKAVALAYDKGIINSTEDSRWDEGITKEESLTFLTSTLSSMPTKGSYQQGASSSDSETSTEVETEVDTPAGAVVEITTPEDEAYQQQLIEEGEISTEVEEVAIEEMDATMYAITNVAVRENYSTTSERLRTLSTGEEVHVTGKTEDGLWMRIEEGEGEAFVASNYLSTEKPVVEEESPATSESESTSSSGGSTDSSTTTPSTEAPVTEVPQQQETVVLEPAPAPEDLPEAPAPDNPSAWESLGEPEYTDGSEFAPTLGDGSNLGTGYEGQGTGMTWQ